MTTELNPNRDFMGRGAKNHREHDFYPTPYAFVETALNSVKISPAPQCILDPGAGTGVWGRAARKQWADAIITGIEIRDTRRPTDYNFWMCADYLLMHPEPCFDLILGNPPYVYSEPFVRQSMKFLEADGHIVMLLRLNFLEGISRRQLWQSYPPKQVIVCSKRISFTDNGKYSAAGYAVYVWQKNWIGETVLKWM